MEVTNFFLFGIAGLAAAVSPTLCPQSSLLLYASARSVFAVDNNSLPALGGENTGVQTQEVLRNDEGVVGEERRESEKSLPPTRKRLTNSSPSRLPGAKSRLLLFAKFVTAVFVLGRLADVFFMCMARVEESKPARATARPDFSQSPPAGRPENGGSPEMCHRLGLVSPGEGKDFFLHEVSSESRKGGMTEQLQDALKSSLTRWPSTLPGMLALAAVALASTMATADASLPVVRQPEATPSQEAGNSTQPGVELSLYGWVRCPWYMLGICHVDLTYTNALLWMFWGPTVPHEVYRAEAPHQGMQYTVYFYIPRSLLGQLGGTDLSIHSLLSDWAKKLDPDRELDVMLFPVPGIKKDVSGGR